MSHAQKACDRLGMCYTCDNCIRSREIVADAVAEAVADATRPRPGPDMTVLDRQVEFIRACLLLTGIKNLNDDYMNQWAGTVARQLVKEGVRKA